MADAVRSMRDDGVRNALVFATSATSSFSGCRQYRNDLENARVVAGEGAPTLTKLRHYFDHPGFVAANVDAVRAALDTLPAGLRDDARLVFTAHSIPVSMNAASGPGADGLYARQLTESAASGHGAGARPRRGVRPRLAVAFRSAAGAVAGAGRERPPAGRWRRRASARWS